MNKPREIHFKTYLKPEPGVVYDMAKCTPDLWTKEQRWEFVEKSAYDALQARLDKAVEALEWYTTHKGFNYSLTDENDGDKAHSALKLIKGDDE